MRPRTTWSATSASLALWTYFCSPLGAAPRLSPEACGTPRSPRWPRENCKEAFMKCLRSQPAVLCGPRSAAASAAGDDSKRQNRRQPQLGVANSWCYRARGARESRDLMAANCLARANQRATRPRCAERTASARASLGAGAAQWRAPHVPPPSTEKTKHATNASGIKEPDAQPAP